MDVTEKIQTDSEQNWYAIYVKPRHEFKVAAAFSGLEIEHYLPTHVVLKQWSDRKKKVREPLFKGYVFIYVNTKERYKALAVESVINTVSFQGKPSVIPDWEIEHLQTMLSNNANVVVSEKIKIGTHVKIIDGPMSGIEGVVYRHEKDEMIAITIELLKRSVSVQLPKESITQKLDKK